MADSGLMACNGGGLVLCSAWHVRCNSTSFTHLQLIWTSVEHDPVSGSRSNWILHFRTGSGLDWILKKTQPYQIWISNLHWSLE